MAAAISFPWRQSPIRRRCEAGPPLTHIKPKDGSSAQPNQRFIPQGV